MREMQRTGQLHSLIANMSFDSQEAGVFGDPQFPTLAIRQAGAHHPVFQAMFKRYSRLELTRATDRPIAVAGIQRRLANAIQSGIAFGVFDKFEHLHRSLLWRRAGNRFLKLRKNEPSRPPTWSWTAFDGAIDYLKVETTKVRWNERIKFEIPLNSGQLVSLEAPVMAFNEDEMQRDQSLLILDSQPYASFRGLRCVIISRQGPMPEGQEDQEVYHILVVSLYQARESYSEYQRLGVASVRRLHIAVDCKPVLARLI